MALFCTCEDWKANIDKVNAGHALLAARNPTTYKGYDGRPFIYCPWCASCLMPNECPHVKITMFAGQHVCEVCKKRVTVSET